MAENIRRTWKKCQSVFNDDIFRTPQVPRQNLKLCFIIWNDNIFRMILMVLTTFWFQFLYQVIGWQKLKSRHFIDKIRNYKIRKINPDPRDFLRIFFGIFKSRSRDFSLGIFRDFFEVFISWSPGCRDFFGIFISRSPGCRDFFGIFNSWSRSPGFSRFFDLGQNKKILISNPRDRDEVFGIPKKSHPEANSASYRV